MQYSNLVLSFFVGLAMGALFFGGLWWTVQKMTASRNPQLISGISFLLRAAVVMAGFYLLVGQGMSGMIAALAGFIVARTYIAYRLGTGTGSGPAGPAPLRGSPGPGSRRGAAGQRAKTGSATVSNISDARDKPRKKGARKKGDQDVH